MSKTSKVLKVAVPLVILAGGVLVMGALVKNRTSPQKEVRIELGALVNTLTVKKTDMRVTVNGTGTVRAAERITVIPQVSGRVTRVAPGLVSGGFFRSGEVLFEIEPTDYRLALEQAEAARARAEYDLARMESQARVARGEWKRLNNGDREPNPLVVYEPQLKDARAALNSANAAVERARLDLERTVIKAPFNARVSSEEVDIGQYVRSGTSVAVLSGTDTAEILVPLPLEELRWIDVPRPPGAGAGPDNGTGALAEVVMTIASDRFAWKGTVVRSLGEVGEKDRMEQVVVNVADPYGLDVSKARGAVRQERSGRPPLTAGAFVDVHIQGRPLNGVYAIPRRAFRDSSTVWTVDKDLRLKITGVEAARIERDTVIITSGLADGDTVVTTTLSGAADGMKLRLVTEGADR